MNGIDRTRRGTHLLAFADGSPRWRRAAKRFTLQANRSGWFTQVTVCDASTLTALDPDFFRRRRELFAAHGPGFGYYCWKPFLLSRYLSLPGLRADRVAYLDVGFHLNVRQTTTARWRQHEQLVDERGLLALHMPGLPEDEWTKPSVLGHFGLDDAQRSSAQILGGLVVLANDDRGRRVAREWEEHASLDGGILLRDPTDASEAGSRLRAHRHDQSVLSCLLKSHRLPSEPDETFYAPRWETDGADSPFWAMRNRSGVAYRRGSRYFWALRAAEKGTLAAQATASGLLRRRPGRFGDSIGERSH